MNFSTRLLLLLTCCIGLVWPVAAQPTARAWAAAHFVGGQLPPIYAATVDGAGNSYIVGTFQNSTRIGGTTLTSRGSLDGYVAKLTPTGTLAWVQQIGASGTEYVYGVGVDAAGNVYVSGSNVNSVNLGNGQVLTAGSGLGYKVFVAQYSPQGVVQWARQGNTGGTYGGQGTGLGVDAAGNVYVTGLFTGSIAFGPTPITLPGGGLASGLFLAKYNSAGTLQWSTLACDFLAIGSVLTYRYPILTVSPSGAAYVLDSFSEQARFGGGAAYLTPIAGWDMLVAKFSSQGTREWLTQVGGANDELVVDAAADQADHLYLSGHFDGATALVGTGAPATRTALTGAGYTNAYLLQLGTAGAVAWAKVFDSSYYPGIVNGGSLAVDAAGNVCQVLSYSIDLNVGTTPRVSGYDNDLAVVSYSPQGNLRWIEQVSGASDETDYFADFDARGDLYLGGITNSQPCRFGSGAGAVSLSSTGGNSDMFVARLANAGSATPTAVRARQGGPLGLYPNPAREAVYLPFLPAGGRVQLLDALGRVVRQTVAAPGVPVSVRGLAPGLYLLRATDAAGQQYADRVWVE